MGTVTTQPAALRGFRVLVHETVVLAVRLALDRLRELMARGARSARG
jgi:hypothetical protein